ncbi:S-layer homology domain-containing protein [Clostridium sp. AM58-1XD]|uniref:S-layer homology domain-containing protein n=1 Tax=Clostridium sp. AM58-1XD TaxID=2292307 RepID=UPI000E4EACFD|nr:S-layer homology domain-containing protein [Clostridium sp. AM58-1XD]RGY99461.1 S-layer homology domain-containing protein [Clostridium sp. AM58-1XD]
MDKRWQAGMMAMVTAVITAVPEPVMSAEAATNFDFRKKVISLSGIMTVNNADQYVTRAEFAEMLVKASEYREIVGENSSVSVFSDVKKDNQYASFVRVAVQNEWMNGYLGGVFRPDQYVTLQEGAKAALTLLGYTNEDFKGDQIGARMAKFEYLDLKEEIGLSAGDPMTKGDCINLFYNLLKAKPKSGNGIYGSVLGCELASDGEISPLAMADVTLQGPKLITSENELDRAVPFKMEDANVYLNGDPSSAKSLYSAADSYLVIYYNSASKTIWGYTPNDSDDSDRCMARGEVTHIYYKSTDVMTPSAIELNDDTEYQIDNSEMQFAFSVYGTVEIGDMITVIYSKSGEGDDDSVTRKILDYIIED